MRRTVVWMALLASSPLALAEYVGVETEQVPIERLIANLEKKATAAGQDLGMLLNLGRLHAMAWVSRDGTAQVRSGTETVWEGYEPARIPWAVDEQEAAEAREARKEHLGEAIRIHREVLKIEPRHDVARLGLGWLLLRAGDRAGAAGVLRPLANEAWEREREEQYAPMTPFLTEEAARYLIEALDEKADAEEIRELQARVAKLEQMPRPITPIAIPLRPGLALEQALAPGARVRFDLDGRERPGTWSWIAPEAGWLVLLPRDGSARIRSGLQLLGSVSWWLFWEHGYAALAALDDDGDGWLRGAELAGLGVWRDADQDGVSDPGEVKPVGAWGVVALACASEPHAHDEVARWSPRGVVFAGGEVRPSWDLLLRYSPR